uniref:Uncharacterized protein n=1 Tax=Arundo donax TaxID=35708 RepID=A0A0A9GXK8_ARUDO
MRWNTTSCSHSSIKLARTSARMVWWRNLQQQRVSSKGGKKEKRSINIS